MSYERGRNKTIIPPNTGDNNRKRKRRKIIVIIIVVTIIVSIVGAVTYFNVFITWIIGGKEPSVWLDSPPDDSIETTNPIEFEWHSKDGDGDPLEHVWYCDVSPSFISPFRIIVDVGANTSYNHTLDDGDWYWKVSVTDNDDGINTSEVWHLTVGENASNHFPSLSGGTVTPGSGYTNTTYFYNVTFTDEDNNTASFVRVYINGTVFTMDEADPLDVNTTDGKLYTYNTTMPIGTHNYTFTCSDGDAVNITPVYTGPTVTSTPPVQVIEVPHDGAINVPLLPDLYVNCSDYDGDTMNATWWWENNSIWYQFGENISFSNNTNITQNNANFSDYNTVYNWSLNLTDGTSWVNNTYSFTTTDVWINTCPESSNATPSNNSYHIDTDVGYWNITITDVDGNNTDGSIECSCGNTTSWINQGDGVKSLEINQSLDWYTTYTVYVNYTDGHCTKNETFTFTTASLLNISLVAPENGSSGHCPNCIMLAVDINSYEGFLMNLTFYSNLSGTWDYFYRGEDNVTFSNCTNGTYRIRVPYFNKYNYQYFWNASVNDGEEVRNLTISTFYTAVSPDECQGGGGTSYAWIIGVIIILSIVPVVMVGRLKRRKKK